MASKRISKHPETRIERGFVRLALSRMVKADWNYKTDDDALSQKLTANLKRNGQLENLVVRELPTGFYEIVNGNHRFDVLSALATETGQEEVMCYNLGAIGTAAAQRIAIELNETRFQTDTLRLAERLQEITQEFSPEELALSMPYSAEEIQRAMRLHEFDWSQFEKRAAENEEHGSDVDMPVHFSLVLSPLQVSLWEEWKAEATALFGACNDEELFERALNHALCYNRG